MFRSILAELSALQGRPIIIMAVFSMILSHGSLLKAQFQKPKPSIPNQTKLPPFEVSPTSATTKSTATQNLNEPVDNAVVDPQIIVEPGEMLGQEPLMDSGVWDTPRGLRTDCCKGCPTFWYTSAEALWVDRNGADNTALSPFLNVGDFDYEAGWRITIGRQLDCLDATEMVYTGIDSWQSNSQAFSGMGLLQSFFAIGALPDFDFANLQTSQYTSRFHSLEWNRRQWGWDIVSSLTGWRLLYLSEDLNFTSIDATPTVGSYQIKTENYMMGYQVGGDLFYPLGAKSTLAAKMKLGGYLNYAEGSTVVQDSGAVFANNSDEELNISALVELGVYYTHRITPRLTLKAGYEFWYLWRAALAPDQYVGAAVPGLGNRLISDSDTFYNGFNFGGEYQW